MLNRWIGILAFLGMVTVNTFLLTRDVLPTWLAGDPPRSCALQLSEGQSFTEQVGIFDAEGRRVGYAWSLCDRDLDLTTIRNYTYLYPLRLPQDISTPALRMDMVLRYRRDHRPDQLQVRVLGLGIPISLEGEFYPPDDFGCEWQVGDQRGKFVLPAHRLRALGDVLRPFESLADLRVGQSWHMETINPLAGLLPGWGAENMMTSQTLVRVVAREPIDFSGQRVDAFVVETQTTRAWVADNGRVLRQEIELPLFGRLVLVSEPYDNETRVAVLQNMIGH